MSTPATEPSVMDRPRRTHSLELEQNIVLLKTLRERATALQTLTSGYSQELAYECEKLRNKIDAALAACLLQRELEA